MAEDNDIVRFVLQQHAIFMAIWQIGFIHVDIGLNGPTSTRASKTSLRWWMTFDYGRGQRFRSLGHPNSRSLDLF